MFKWLKLWIVKFVGVMALAEIIDKHVSRLGNENKELKNKIKELDGSIGTMERCFNIGMDVEPIEGRHWAIICVRQKNEQSVIRFVDLSRRDPVDIRNFMEYFTPDRANKCIDMPHGFMRY